MGEQNAFVALAEIARRLPQGNDAEQFLLQALRLRADLFRFIPRPLQEQANFAGKAVAANFAIWKLLPEGLVGDNTVLKTFNNKLAEHLTSLSWEYRKEALQILQRIGKTDPARAALHLQQIIRSLADPHWEVRSQVPDLLHALESHLESHHVASIEALASDPLPGVLSNVEWALNLLDDNPDAKAAYKRVTELATLSDDIDATLRTELPGVEENSAPSNARVSDI